MLWSLSNQLDFLKTYEALDKYYACRKTKQNMANVSANVSETVKSIQNSYGGSAREEDGFIVIIIERLMSAASRAIFCTAVCKTCGGKTVDEDRRGSKSRRGVVCRIKAKCSVVHAPDCNNIYMNQ